MLPPLITRHRAAELLNSIPELPRNEGESKETAAEQIPSFSSRNLDTVEAGLEAAEINKYLLAKSLFDCREYDRCAAVFLPDSLLAGVVSTQSEDQTTAPKKKDRATVSGAGDRASKANELPEISQKSLFLTLYAKVISGEKRKDEESEMVMGPHDLGTTTNRQLRVVRAYLHQWFNQIANEDGEHVGSQGWLEYLLVATCTLSKAELMPGVGTEWCLRRRRTSLRPWTGLSEVSTCSP